MKPIQSQPFSIYPDVTRTAVVTVLPESGPWQEIAGCAQRAAANLPFDVRVRFVEATSKHVLPGERQYVFDCIYQSDERTLTREEVNEAHARLLRNLDLALQAAVQTYRIGLESRHG